MTVGVGICTYNRPDMFHKTVRAALKHLAPVVDRWYVYDDGSDAQHNGAYKRAWRPLEETGAWIGAGPNRGVAYAKNRLLDEMLADGHEALFLLEDDIRVLSERAVIGYLEAANRSQLHHLSFAHHGPGNTRGPVGVGDGVSFYPHAIGAWCLYSRYAIETVGGFDEHFVNAWEHVEHTLRLAEAGLTTGAGMYADATGSERWLAEIPGSIDKSSIRPRPDWHHNIAAGLAYWRANKRSTFDVLFGPGCELEVWAARMLATVEVAA